MQVTLWASRTEANPHAGTEPEQCEPELGFCLWCWWDQTQHRVSSHLGTGVQRKIVLTCWRPDKHNGKDKELPREGSAPPNIKLKALEGSRIFWVFF